MELDVFHAEYVQETAPLVERAEAILLEIERRIRGSNPSEEPWTELLSPLHTIKGNSGMMRYLAIQALVHEMESRAKAARGASADVQLQAVETLLAAVDVLRSALSDPAAATEACEAAAAEMAASAPEAPPVVTAPPSSPAPAAAPLELQAFAARTSSDVRVPADRLDRLLELVGEMAIHHDRLRVLAEELGQSRDPGDREGQLLDAVDRLSKTLAELRAGVTESRLLPLSQVFGRFERLVRDLCRRTGKQAALHLEGAEMVVDKAIIDVLAEPLLHILNNAVDHGLEPPAERLAAGKPRTGRIVVSARSEHGSLLVSVRDDGRGLSRARLIEKARALGIDASAWPDAEVFELVFLSGLTTAERVSELSGRGVGLDAARRSLEKLGGSVQIATQPGRGTELRIRIPLSLTIRRALLIERHAEVYAVPVTSVVESIRLHEGEIHALDTQASGGGRVLHWRGRWLPVGDLGDHVGRPAGATAARPSLCVVVEDERRARGLFVDRVLGQQDLVMKQLDPQLGSPAGLSGAAILGDGSVVMVLDPRTLGGTRAAEKEAR